MLKPRLIIAEPRAQVAEELATHLKSHPRITVQPCKLDQLNRAPDVDACYLSIMAAERWGAAFWGGGNLPPINEAQIFKTSDGDRNEGWPAYILAGVRLSGPEDVFNYPVCLRRIIGAIVRAVVDFNTKSQDKIETVALDVGFTCIEKVEPQLAMKTIRDAYDREADSG